MTLEAEIDRTKMVKAMEYICRQINNEVIWYRWATLGVPDGDIEYGDLDWFGDSTIDVDESIDYLIEDERFAELMEEFMYCMALARKNGGLYCGDIVSHKPEEKSETN